MKQKRQHITRMPNNGQQGFTLVEFMVASVLGLVVIAGAGSLYSYTKRLNDVGLARVSTLQDLRAAATMITQDARNAGTFGCANLGRRFAPDSTNCLIQLANTDGTIGVGTVAGTNDIIALQTLDENGSGNMADRSAGVRWFADATPLANIWNGVQFTPASGALLFYYGEGSLSFNSMNGANVVFNTNEQHPNKVVESVLKTGGWLVAAGCNTIAFQQSNGGSVVDTYEVTTVAPLSSQTTTANTTAPTATGIYPAILPNSDMILQRYKIVAYVVGNIPGEPSSLYRFEFGNNGNSWTAPQQLARNVTNMTAEYLFVTDCPSAVTKTSSGTPVTQDELNGQTFTVQQADGSNNAIADISKGSNNEGAQGPSSIRLDLTYNFPNIRGGSVATGGGTANAPQNETFRISAVVRGGNVCASRKISQ
ncbi:MAG: prepilin-type N-terminal cleavage/methylation domain-containing protein [Neisseriaceae bacterium]|nr:prepilin-type N-terminal cleavage/methylation domain-containing protein [Neisseriaceae bacterium]